MSHGQRLIQALLGLSGAAVAVAALSLGGCGGGNSLSVQDNSSQGQWSWALPANFPPPFVPADNPMSAAKVELGRFLFYDRRLSGNGQQACASCHLQEKAFTDGRQLAVGSTGETHPRNAQGLANVVYHPTLTWAACWRWRCFAAAPTAPTTRRTTAGCAWANISTWWPTPPGCRGRRACQGPNWPNACRR